MYEYRRLTPEQKKAVVAQRLAKGHPPHQPPHPVREATNYLITAACYEHRPIMREAARRQQLLETLFSLAEENRLDVRGWVILFNHYHLLVCVETFAHIQQFCRKLHGGLAYQWNGEDSSRGRQVWYRFSDRAIRSERHSYATLNYIHYNPVKHGLTESPYDYPYSSVHWYLEAYGRHWLRDKWKWYPVNQLGKDWDNYDE